MTPRASTMVGASINASIDDVEQLLVTAHQLAAAIELAMGEHGEQAAEEEIATVRDLRDSLELAGRIVAKVKERRNER